MSDDHLCDHMNDDVDITSNALVYVNHCFDFGEKLHFGFVHVKDIWHKHALNT